jgi:hypothetical protein
MSDVRGSLAAVVRVAALACLTLLGAHGAHADEFSDFRIPKNEALLWSLRLDASGNRIDANDPNRASRTGQLGGTVSSDFEWLSDSEPSFTTVLGRLSLAGDRFSADQSQIIEQPVAISEIDEDHQTHTAESWSVIFEHRRYPSVPPLFLTVHALAFGAYGQTWVSDRTDATAHPAGPTQQTITERNDSATNYSHRVSAGAGFGIGRVRNPTGIYEAQVLEQRLRETGALTRDLSPEARRRLANVMYVRRPFDFTTDRPGKEVWQEIERILSDDGALAERGLDPYSVLRAEEPHFGTGDLLRDGVPVSPVLRQTGALVSLFLDVTSDYAAANVDFHTFTQQVVDDSVVGESRFSQDLHADDSRDQVLLSLEGQYHRPVGPHWQLDGFTRVSLPLQKDDSSFQWRTDLSATWLVADRWIGSAFLSQDWFDADRIGDSLLGNRTTWEYGAGVSYYIEDSLLLTLAAKALQQDFERFEAPPSPSSSSFRRSQSVSLGLTYFFAGWFAAPGMYPAATPR